MRHPFETWPSRHRRRAFLALFAASILTAAVLVWTGDGTMTDEAPRGQVSLQFAGDRAEARQIVESWEREGVMHRIGLNIGFDYVFMLVYSTALAAACAAVASRCRWRTRTALPTVGVVLGYGAWLSGVLDAVENALMVPILGDPVNGGSPGLVQAFATGKYVLIVLALLYVLVGWLATWRDNPNLFSLSGPPP